MSRPDTAWSLPDRTVESAETADREIRISDFALMAILPLRVVEIEGYPANELAMAALVGLCLFRPSRGGAKLPALAMLLLTGLLTLLVFSGVANDIDWIRRVGHVTIVAGLVWAGGTGRLSTRSVAAGLAAGLISVIALALVGIGGDAYAGRLTGFLGDPNAGAYFIVVLGLPAIFFADARTKVRLALAVPLVAGLILCYSRTGLLAALFAAAWLLVGRRLPVISGAILAAGLVWVVDSIPDDLTTVGPFSDRSGSDELRSRIIAQERVQLADAPWFGEGPGTATVYVRGQDFFFHNSYLATRQEGGWGALLLVLALLVVAFIYLGQQTRQGDLTAAATQAALIGTAVMAITLGEVLLDTPMAIAVGLALGHTLTRDADPAEVPDG